MLQIESGFEPISIHNILQSSDRQSSNSGGAPAVCIIFKAEHAFSDVLAHDRPELESFGRPAAATHTFDNPGKRSMMKLPDALIS